MAFEDVLHFDLCSPKNLIWPGPCLLHTLLLQLRKVPNSNGLIQRGTRYERVVWMESSTHHVVTMPCEDGNHASILPVPEPDGLIITA